MFTVGVRMMGESVNTRYLGLAEQAQCGISPGSTVHEELTSEFGHPSIPLVFCKLLLSRLVPTAPKAKARTTDLSLRCLYTCASVTCITQGSYDFMTCYPLALNV